MDHTQDGGGITDTVRNILANLTGKSKTDYDGQVDYDKTKQSFDALKHLLADAQAAQSQASSASSDRYDAESNHAEAVQQLNTQIAEILKQLDNSQKSNDECNAKVSDHTLKIKDLEDRLRTCNDEKSTLEASLAAKSAAESTNDDTDEQITEAENECKLAREAIKAGLVKCETEMKKLQEEIETHNTEPDTTELVRLQAELNQSRGKLEDAEAKVSELETAALAHKSEIAEKTREIAECKEKLVQATSAEEVERLNAQISKLEAEVARLTETNDGLQSNDAEIAGLNKKLSAKDTEIVQLQEKIKEAVAQAGKELTPEQMKQLEESLIARKLEELKQNVAEEFGQGTDPSEVFNKLVGHLKNTIDEIRQGILQDEIQNNEGLNIMKKTLAQAAASAYSSEVTRMLDIYFPGHTQSEDVQSRIGDIIKSTEYKKYTGLNDETGEPEFEEVNTAGITVADIQDIFDANAELVKVKIEKAITPLLNVDNLGDLGANFTDMWTNIQENVAKTAHSTLKDSIDSIIDQAKQHSEHRKTELAGHQKNQIDKAIIAYSEKANELFNDEQSKHNAKIYAENADYKVRIDEEMKRKEAEIIRNDAEIKRIKAAEAENISAAYAAEKAQAEANLVELQRKKTELEIEKQFCDFFSEYSELFNVEQDLLKQVHVKIESMGSSGTGANNNYEHAIDFGTDDVDSPRTLKFSLAIDVKDIEENITNIGLSKKVLIDNKTGGLIRDFVQNEYEKSEIVDGKNSMITNINARIVQYQRILDTLTRIVEDHVKMAKDFEEAVKCCLDKIVLTSKMQISFKDTAYKLVENTRIKMVKQIPDVTGETVNEAKSAAVISDADLSIISTHENPDSYEITGSKTTEPYISDLIVLYRLKLWLDKNRINAAYRVDPYGNELKKYEEIAAMFSKRMVEIKGGAYSADACPKLRSDQCKEYCKICVNIIDELMNANKELIDLVNDALGLVRIFFRIRKGHYNPNLTAAEKAANPEDALKYNVATKKFSVSYDAVNTRHMGEVDYCDDIDYDCGGSDETSGFDAQFFTGVFGPDTTTNEIYYGNEDTIDQIKIRDILTSFFNGSNVTSYAYGGSGSGKTFTLIGGGKGLINEFGKDIRDKIKQSIAYYADDAVNDPNKPVPKKIKALTMSIKELVPYDSGKIRTADAFIMDGGIVSGTQKIELTKKNGILEDASTRGTYWKDLLAEEKPGGWKYAYDERRRNTYSDIDGSTFTKLVLWAKDSSAVRAGLENDCTISYQATDPYATDCGGPKNKYDRKESGYYTIRESLEARDLYAVIGGDAYNNLISTADVPEGAVPRDFSFSTVVGKGSEEHDVDSIAKAVENILTYAFHEDNRETGRTPFNPVSSRSHAFIEFHLEFDNDKNEKCTAMIADLAGIERQLGNGMVVNNFVNSLYESCKAIVDTGFNPNDAQSLRVFDSKMQSLNNSIAFFTGQTFGNVGKQSIFGFDNSGLTDISLLENIRKAFYGSLSDNKNRLKYGEYHKYIGPIINKLREEIGAKFPLPKSSTNAPKDKPGKDAIYKFLIAFCKMIVETEFSPSNLDVMNVTCPDPSMPKDTTDPNKYKSNMAAYKVKLAAKTNCQIWKDFPDIHKFEYDGYNSRIEKSQGLFEKLGGEVASSTKHNWVTKLYGLDHQTPKTIKQMIDSEADAYFTSFAIVSSLRYLVNFIKIYNDNTIPVRFKRNYEAFYDFVEAKMSNGVNHEYKAEYNKMYKLRFNSYKNNATKGYNEDTHNTQLRTCMPYSDPLTNNYNIEMKTIPDSEYNRMLKFVKDRNNGEFITLPDGAAANEMTYKVPDNFSTIYAGFCRDSTGNYLYQYLTNYDIDPGMLDPNNNKDKIDKGKSKIVKGKSKTGGAANRGRSTSPAKSPSASPSTQRSRSASPGAKSSSGPDDKISVYRDQINTVIQHTTKTGKTGYELSDIKAPKQILIDLGVWSLPLDKLISDTNTKAQIAMLNYYTNYMFAYDAGVELVGYLRSQFFYTSTKKPSSKICMFCMASPLKYEGGYLNESITVPTIRFAKQVSEIGKSETTAAKQEAGRIQLMNDAKLILTGGQTGGGGRAPTTRMSMKEIAESYYQNSGMQTGGHFGLLRDFGDLGHVFAGLVPTGQAGGGKKRKDKKHRRSQHRADDASNDGVIDNRVDLFGIIGVNNADVKFERNLTQNRRPIQGGADTFQDAGAVPSSKNIQDHRVPLAEAALASMHLKERRRVRKSAKKSDDPTKTKKTTKSTRSTSSTKQSKKNMKKIKLKKSKVTKPVKKVRRRKSHRSVVKSDDEIDADFDDVQIDDVEDSDEEDVKPKKVKKSKNEDDDDAADEDNDDDDVADDADDAADDADDANDDADDDGEVGFGGGIRYN